MFLDALTVRIKLSFISAGNKDACNIEHSLKCLLNKDKMQNFKEKIDLQFFTGLEKHLGWIALLRDSRDGLVHSYHYLVFTNTKQGELGYDIMNKDKKQWGTETVRSIRVEIQTVINNISELMEFLYDNLPRKEVSIS
jgi:hypothetical protein